MKSKRLLLMLLIAILAPWAANAQTVTIGIGTSTQNMSPMANYYDLSFTEMIYTAEEIAAGNPTEDNILSVGFQLASNGLNNKTYSIAVYMKNYDADEFGTATFVSFASTDAVFTGTVTATTSGWVTIDLDSPFAYDNTKNLLIGVNKTAGGYAGSSFNWNYTSTSKYQHLYKQQDGTNVYDPTNPPTSPTRNYNRPNVQLTFGVPPTCFAPKNLTCTEYTATSATLTWQRHANGTENAWVLQYSTDNTFATGVQSVNVSNTPSTQLTDLTAETKYYVRVRPDCDENLWSDVCEFKPSAAVCDQIGTGTETAYLVYTSYGCTYSQHIYTADELTDMGFSAGDIVSVSFRYSGTSSTYQKTQSIYMGTTTKSSYSGYTASDFESEVTLVYGPEELSYVAGWREYELTEPFTWDGTSNIVVGMLTNGSNQTTSSGWSAYGTSTDPDYRTIYRYRDRTPIDITDLASVNNGNRSQIRPNMHLCITPSTKPRNLTVSNLSSSGATLAWDAPAGSYPTGYEYQYKTSTGEWPTAWTSNGTNLSVPLSGLTASTSYTFRVRATYAESNSEPVEITFTSLDDCAFPTNLVATTTPGQGTKATLTWVKGYDEEAWVLEYATNNTFTEGLVEVTDGFTVEGNNVTANLTGLTAETHYYARVKANCDGPTSAWSDVAEFTPTNYVDYTFGETPYSTVSSVPFYGNYANYGTLSQFIIPAAQLADVAGGTIRRLTFYSSTATASWGDAVFEVYVKEVEASSFESANAEGLEDWTTMTNVYSGSLSVINSQMVIELDNSFSYNGGNLMIGFNETTTGTSSSVSWRYVQGPSNSALYAYKTSSSGSLTYYRNIYLPRITFNYQPTSTPRPIITEPVATTDVTATVAWTKPSDNVTGYKYQYKLASETVWSTEKSLGADAVSVTVPNLTPNTSYDFQIKAVYAEGESVASSTSFATACPVATPVPYTYDFETAPKFNCWTVISGNITRMSGSAHASSSYRLDFRGTNSNMIALPAFAEATNTLRIEFWTRPESSTAPSTTNNYSGKFAVGYMTDIADANTFVAIATYNNTDWAESLTYTKKVVDFDVTGVPADAYIAMRQFDCETNYYWYVDDVKVKVIPTCADVNDVHYVSFTNHSATIAWTAEAAQTAWQIAYKAGANFDPNNAEELATATIIPVTSNPYLFDKNLAAETTYYMYVRGNCGDVDGLGDWSDSYATFKTKAAAPAPSNFTASNFGKRTVDLVWTAGGGDYETSWELYYVASATAPTAPDDETEATKTVNTLPTTEEPYTLGGLTPETRYYIWVRANHGNDDKSVWTALTGSSFTTDIACHAPTNVAASNITNNSAVISWESDAASFNIRYREYVVPTETLYDFENGMGDWTTIDADHDGYDWVLGSATDGVYTYGDNLSGSGYNSSTDLIVSGSYRNIDDENGEALTPDNYLVSPLITLGGTISFYAHGSNTSYIEEHFGVFVSTGSNDNPDDFVMVNEWTASTTDYIEYSADLSAYSGQGYVAIRHFNCTDMFLLSIDNITITEPVAGQIWIVIEDVTSPQPIPGLTAETTYEVQVQAVCGGEDGESVWTSLAEPFTTLSNCSAPGELNATDITGTSATLSWSGAQESYNVRYRKLVAGPEVTTTENFSEQTPAGYSSIGELPEGWRSYTTNSYTPHVSNAANYSNYIADLDGNYLLLTTNGSTSGNVCAIMPKYDNLIAVSFNYAFESTGSCGTLEVGYVTDNSGYSTFVRLGDAIQPAAGWNSNPYTLSSSDISTINSVGGYVAFKYNSNSTTYYSAAIDNITVTTQSVTASEWNETNTNVTSPLPISGLEMNTTYQWQVQGINASCDGGLTAWSDMGSFITPYPTFTKTINAFDTENEKGWYLIASPLVGAIDPTTMTNLITDNADDFALYRFNQSATLEWENWKAEANYHFNLESGRGYLYGNTNGGSITFTGMPYSGNGKVTLSKDDDAVWAGWNLVGNPFAEVAYLPNGMEYYTLNDAGSELTAAEGNSVEAMEGIFVIAGEDGETLTFSTTNPNPGKGASLSLNVTRNRGSVIDRAIVRFGESNTLPKFQLNPNHTKVYIPQYGKDYAVVSAESQGAMPVNFKAEENGTYTLSFNAEEVSFNYLHLIDNMTGNDVDLLQNPSYSFNATTTDYESRFKLVFCTGDNSNDDSFAFFSNGNWIINNDGEATLQVIDVNGRILSSETVSGSVSKAINATPGVYMIRLINGENVRVQKIVVR